MRIRNGLVLCLILTSLVGVGCRKALSPNVDRNQPPETWITAAPQDTITLKNPNGSPIPGSDSPQTIPVKFHVYWAGSDPDGDISGFYYAVVETLPYNPLGAGPVPQLPGPKARDYHFTTRTDSTFIFSVSDIRPDRQHAFYIYAVDNDGKPDPTPARVIFNALDKYPPLVSFVEARGTGVVWERAAGGGVFQRTRTYQIRDSVNNATVPSDSLPATARIDFSWRSEPVVPGNPAVKYRYKLDETDFVEVDSSVHVVTYNSGVADAVAPGRKVFTLRAIDLAGGKNQAIRRFQFNLSPDTWFSGPDPSSSQFNQVEAGSGFRFYDACLGGWKPELTGSLLSRDSVFLLPALRPERKTFFEIYGCKIYVHSEYDTVNMNSWVICHNGGLDADSPYLVKVNPTDPEYKVLIGPPPGGYGQVPPVLQPGPSNGSPIGFRYNMAFTLVPTLQPASYTQTSIYPIYDPNDVQRLPSARLAAYWPVNQAGQAYMFARAVDGNGASVGGLDEQIAAQTVAQIVATVGPSLTGGNDSLRALRRKIITFYVDHAPELDMGSPTFPNAFKPLPNTQYFSRVLDVNLLSVDMDPYDALADKKPTGGPTTPGATRFRVTVRGQTAAGADTAFTDYAQPPYRTAGNFSIVLPNWLVGTAVTLEVEICDCRECENLPGTGRCRTYSIPVRVPAPVSPQGASSMDIRLGEPGPGSNQDVRSAEE